MINLYPLPNANNPALGYNYVNEPVRKLNEGEFDVRLDHNFSANDYAFARFSYDQATSYVPGGSPGFAEQVLSPATRASSITDATWRYLKPTFFPEHRQSDSTSATTAFSTTSPRRAPAVAQRKPWHSRRKSGRRQLRPDFHAIDGGYWSLGDRGYAPFQGGTNVFSVLRFARHGARQARHQGRRRHSRQPDERHDRGLSRMDIGSSPANGEVSPRPISAGPSRPRHSRSNLQRQHHRPPLETLPPLCARRLASH